MSVESIPPALIAAAVGAVLGLFAGVFKDRLTMRFEQRLEERRKLRELQSRYKGRILEAALDWDRRMMQIYEGTYEHLDPDDEERTHVSEYYFQSVVFRFLQLTAVARRFEGEAFYFDPSIAKGKDYDLLRYAKAMLWVMIHAEISPDDGQPGEDHFRSDAFRPLLDFCYSTPPLSSDGNPRSPVLLPETRGRDNELVFDFDRYLAMLKVAGDAELKHPAKGYIKELLALVDGVRPDDYAKQTGRQRRRWDRFVALHLITLGFIEACGYKWHHRDTPARVRLATSMLLDPERLRDEFDNWMPRLGLGPSRAARWRFGRKREMWRVQAALCAVAEDSAEALRAIPAEDASAIARTRAKRVHEAITLNRQERKLPGGPPELEPVPEKPVREAEPAQMMTGTR